MFGIGRCESVAISCFVVLIMLGFQGCSAPMFRVSVALGTSADWPMFRCSAARSGNPDSIAPVAHQLLWSHLCVAAQEDDTRSPAVAGGVLYTSVFQGYVYALNATTGLKLWNFTAGNWVLSSPAVAGGVVYVGSDDGNLYALDVHTGAKLWNFATSAWMESSPAVPDGVVYVGSYDGNLYALNATTGLKLWNFTTGGIVLSSPVVSGGVVFVGSGDDNVYALNVSTGAELWNLTTSGRVYSSPAVVAGVVYAGSWDGKVYAANASTGSQVWNFTTGNRVESSPVVAGDVVYVGSDDDNVYALNASTGTMLWKYGASSSGSSPAFVDGVVYVGSGDGNLYALDASTGSQLWNFTVGGIVSSSPAVVDGVVYVGSSFGYVFALGTPVSASSTQSTTTVACYPNPVFANSMVTCTAAVSGSSITGEVVWSTNTASGSFSQTVCTLSNGTCSTTYNDTNAGNVTITATYLGNSASRPSTSTTILQVLSYATVLINPDGSIFPPAAPISTSDNVTYTFAGDLNGSIVVNRNDVIIDGNGHTLQGNGGGTGIDLSSMSGVTVKNLRVSHFLYGIWLNGSSSIIVSENNVTDCGLSSPVNVHGAGVWLSNSWNDTVSGNTLSDNSQSGLSLSYSSNVTATKNLISNNNYGVSLENSSDNIVSDNNVAANSDAIWIDSSQSNNIDDNNVTANTHGGVGLEGSSANSVSGNTIINNYQAVSMTDSSNDNNVTRNTITNNHGGGVLVAYSSSSNNINRNNMTANKYGVGISYASNNAVTGNEIGNNNYGIDLSYSSGDTIYHNNFENNFAQVQSSSSVGNVWDDGYPSGGNYWSDYNGIDSHSGPYQNVTGSDGIGDTLYPIDQSDSDNYPLMGILQEFTLLAPSAGIQDFTLVSNSTISNLTLAIWLSSPINGLQPGQQFIQFSATGENGSTGFCMLTIPRTLLNTSSYIVLVDSQPINATELPQSNSTTVYLYFTYSHSTHQVIVTIPEFSFLILPLLLATTLLTAAICRRKTSCPA